MKISKWRDPIQAGGPAFHQQVDGISSISTQLLVGLVLLFACAALVDGQQPIASPATPPRSDKHVVGFENVKPNAKGALAVQGEELEFKTPKGKAEVSISSVQAVFTDQDFKQVIGGSTGTLAKMAIPYGGGRVLSLFQEKIDVLTVEYRDTSGGLHGAIFTLPKGHAQPIERQLVALGAHATILPEEPAKPAEKQR